MLPIRTRSFAMPRLYRIPSRRQQDQISRTQHLHNERASVRRSHSVQIRRPASFELWSFTMLNDHNKYSSGSMWAGVSIVSNVPQLSGCIKVSIEDHKYVWTANTTTMASFTRTCAKLPKQPSIVKCPDAEGKVRCNKTTWIPINATVPNANKKWRAVNLRRPYEDKTASPRIAGISKSAKTGTTDAKFKITIAAQNDMLPATRT